MIMIIFNRAKSRPGRPAPTRFSLRCSKPPLPSLLYLL